MKITPNKSQNIQTTPKSKTPTKSYKIITNRSYTPLAKQPSQAYILATKSPMKTKFNSEMEQISLQMSINKDRLLDCLKLYQVLQTTQLNKKCFQHNDLLTLYCLNERKILCVKCLSGVNKHRSHQVLPLKDCMEQIYKDNRKMKKRIQQQVMGLDELKEIASENIKTLQQQMRCVEQSIEKQYRIKIEELEQVFKNSLAQIRQTFNPLILTCQKVKETGDLFRFNIWQAYTMQLNWKDKSENEIMKQVLFYQIIELCTFKNRAITRNELNSLSRRFQHMFNTVR